MTKMFNYVFKAKTNQFYFFIILFKFMYLHFQSSVTIYIRFKLV